MNHFVDMQNFNIEARMLVVRSAEFVGTWQKESLLDNLVRKLSQYGIFKPDIRTHCRNCVDITAIETHDFFLQKEFNFIMTMAQSFFEAGI